MTLICIMKNSLSIFVFVIINSCLMANNDIYDAITQVGPKGAGNDKLVKNWHLVDSMSSSDIPRLLKIMNQANNLGDNWARAAVFQILENAGKEVLPKDETIAFIKDQNNQGSSRRAAYEFINYVSPQVAQSLVSAFIDDPEPTLRREAVELLLTQADNLVIKEQAIEAYEYALEKARDVDQIESASKSLDELGKPINITERMGFLTGWQVIGPFDNSSRGGFNEIYSPEIGSDFLKKAHTGKNGSVQWQTFSTTDRLGLLDLNQPFGHIKEVLCYAYSEFESSLDQRVQFRIGSKNAWKLWINQELVFARDEYHRGATRVDQFILDGNLKKGKNQILVKVCQNEQTESWTKQWEFCFRITDLSGSPIKTIN